MLSLMLMYAVSSGKRSKNVVHARRRAMMHEMPEDMTYFGSEKSKKPREKNVGRSEKARAVDSGRRSRNVDGVRQNRGGGAAEAVCRR